MTQQKMIDILQYHAARLSEVADMQPEDAMALLDAVGLIEAAAELCAVSSRTDLTTVAGLLRDAVECIDSAPVRPSPALRLVVDAAGDIDAVASALVFTLEGPTR